MFDNALLEHVRNGLTELLLLLLLLLQMGFVCD